MSPSINTATLLYTHLEAFCQLAGIPANFKEAGIFCGCGHNFVVFIILNDNIFFLKS